MATAKSRSIMGKDQFERFIQDRLSNHEIPINTQDLWAGIEPTLPPRKRPLGPWLIGASVLLFLIATSLWFLRTDNEAAALTTQFTPDRTQTTNNLKTTNNSNIETAALIDSDSDNDNDPAPNDASFQMASATDEEVDHAAEMNNADEGIDDSKLLKTAETAQSVTRGTIQKNNETSSADSHDKLASLHETKGLRKPNSVREEDDLKNDAIVRMALGNPPSFGADDGISVRFSPRVGSAQNSGESEVAESSTTGLRVEKVLDFLSADLNVTESANSQLSRDILPGLNDCYDFTERWWAWGLDIYGGLHYTHKSLTGNSDNGELDAYIDARKDTESALEAYEFGVALNLMHRRGFVASVGFNYSQINEEFNYLRERRETMFDSIVVRINIDSSGRVDSIRDWRPVTVQYTEEILTYNSFRMVDIPVGLGYQFANGNMIFEIQAGLMLNLAFIKEGEILSSSLDVMGIDDATFKTQVGLSGWLGVKALYPVSRRWSIYAEPIARINFVPVTVDSYNLTQRYNRFGMRLGARMAF